MHHDNRLLPVTSVIVRSCDAADLKSLVLTLIHALSIEVNAELIVKALEERLVRH